MTWTLIMLAIAFGLTLSGVRGWRQERREEARSSEPIPAGQPESESARMAMPARPAGNRHIYANART